MTLNFLPYCAMSCSTMPCCMPCNNMTWHDSTGQDRTYHRIPCHAMPCHAMPCHAMPCHAILPVISKGHDMIGYASKAKLWSAMPCPGCYAMPSEVHDAMLASYRLCLAVPFPSIFHAKPCYNMNISCHPIPCHLCIINKVCMVTKFDAFACWLCNGVQINDKDKESHDMPCHDMTWT